MNIPITDLSPPQKADIERYVNGGKIEYKLRFKCAHERVQVMNGEVLCRDCDNRDLTVEQEVSLLESYADLIHSIEEDRIMQS